MNESDEEDPSQLLPWPPLVKERENIGKSPIGHTDTPHPRTSRFSPRFQLGNEGGITLTPISEGGESDDAPCTPVSSMPQFDPDRLPWSPLPRPRLTIAYVFGNYRHPLVEQIIPLLQLKHEINLICSVSEQPPKPFPLFYLYKEGDNIAKVLKVGNECSDGHCILIFPDDKKLPSNFAEIECTTLLLKVEKETYDPKDIETLCQQMDECTKRVYEPKASANFLADVVTPYSAK